MRTIYRFFDPAENLCFIIVSLLPLVIKLSIIELNRTLQSILSFKFKSPYHTAHLPNLIENYLKKHAIFPVPEKFNKSTLFSMGFLGSEIERVLLAGKDQNPQTATEEVRKAAYLKIIETLTRALQKHPKSEILMLTIAQIRFHVFGDSFKALDIVNKIPEAHQSFAGRVSVKAICNHFAEVNQDTKQFDAQNEKRKNSHLSYFTYRSKIQFFKTHIKTEIQDHIKLWKGFGNHESDVFSAVNQASRISSHTREITKYWYKNFEGQESSYVNASLMYGLYLEIVQAIPSGGYAFIKKAYTAINNKWHAWRDVIDVTVGSSAVIVASIEPDKIGKIIDTSSSVKELFKTSKQGLIGTNIAVVLPNFVAVKHNDLIRNYQKEFKGNIDHFISSYAKTLQDEYFKVEVTLHVSPLTHKGLNLVSYIRKLSEPQSLMIVNPRGNIVEYSQDLSLPLNLFMKKSHLKIESLCPDFKKINQAFAVLYKNSTNDDAQTNKRDDQTEYEETLLQSPKPRHSRHFDSLVPLISPVNQRLLSNSNMENEVVFFKSLQSENNEPVVITKNTVDTRNNMPIMNQEEAQEIWDSFKDSKELTFYPYNKKELQAQIKYSTEIEPFFFDNKWYKIIKMKTHSSHPQNLPVSHQIFQPEEPIFSVVDDFADDFPSVDERTEAEEEMPESQKRSPRTIKSIKYNKTQTLSLEKKSDSQIFGEENSSIGPAAGGGQIDIKKFSNKAQSKMSSQATQKMTAKRLQDSLKIEKQSTSSKLVVTLVYFTVFAIVCSVCVHLIYTKSSLTEMQSSINIVRTVNTRLAKTVLNWQAMMVLYSRSVGLRPIDFKIPMYKAITIASSLAVIENAKELAEEADDFANKDLVSTLYAKTISLYEPFDHTLFDGHSIDQFTVNSVLIEYYLWVARYNGSYLDLSGNREFLFAINNTANDYLLALDRSVNYLTNFFDDTRIKNIRLITGITAVEILLVLSPLALILAILFIIVRTYSKLFQAISKINENSLAKRVKQLEDISTLFEGNLEDDVSSFHKFKSEGLTIKTLVKKSATTSRKFSIRGLTIHLSKYISLAAGLITIIIVLVVIALQKSVQDLENLDTISHKALTVYSVSSQIRMIQPSFQISIIFYNDTSYKIRNDAPETQLLHQLDVLDDANTELLSVLTDSNNEISDPVIKDILDGNVCQYVSSTYQVNCIQNTKGGAYGLLGLHSFYSLICQYVKEWTNTATPTFTVGVDFAAKYSNMNNNIHFVLFDIYDYLSNYLVGTFLEAAEEDKTEIQDMFYRNLAAVLVAMFLIRVIVIKKLQVFDLGIRRILRIIPYRIIEENKVMSCYLARTFQDELKVLQQIG